MAEKAVKAVESEELADNAKHTTDSQAYDACEVVIASCTNGTPAPTQPCRVALELSTDDVAWVVAASKQFGPIEGVTYLAAFPLSEFAATGPWRHYRLTFSGNVGGKVEIAANTGEAPPTPAEKEAKGEKGAKGEDKKHETHPGAHTAHHEKK